MVMQKVMFAFVMVVFNLVFMSNVLAKTPSGDFSYCADPKLQKARSDELQRLLAADQSCREDMSKWSKKNFKEMIKRDMVRRKRVGEIFAEGCLRTPQDYLAAALIYQHGDVPDHYYQAYIWAARAIELGGKNAKSMVAVAIDRYLVSLGKKQLFGSQFYSDDTQPNHCFCMRKVELSFPDSLRQEYLGKALQESSYEKFAMFNQGKQCPNVECSEDLKPTPKGTVPGLW